ncbi:M15 family metallopeptidase [Chryseobacterium sp. CBSDS_008]|uniref:M15 family metallopeptidase n=1 Tax=Chryseobacterium sp. CBSDS_008 TaxID=3415265 RepID=UPI003CF8F577
MTFNKHFIFYGTLFLLLSCASQNERLLKGFVYVQDYIPDMIVDLRYFGPHNFTGRPVNGYERPVLIMSYQAVQALTKVQTQLKSQGLGLKAFDAYRPQRAVDSFEIWAKDISDTIAKSEFYPHVKKNDLFRLNYLASKSGHTRGSTIDVTLINLETKEELDMGSPFDFFGEISHQHTLLINEKQKANREILKQIMLENNFKEYNEEWWHFTLVNEPFPDTYFDFIIK